MSCLGIAMGKVANFPNPFSALVTFEILRIDPFAAFYSSHEVILRAVSPDRPPPSLMRCEYYNETLCQGSPGADGQPLPGCNGSEECRPGENEKGNLCYVLWQNNSGVLSVKLKGCWVGNNHDCSQSQHCAVTRREPSVQLLFCCCVGDLCNANLQPSAVITSGFAPDALAN
ncbi:hypothetical protein HPB51_014536 [Rhipicephalus microplus]|uniref:Activin types I and II receptor domain-containing protein n=1 Tax=Rhipicephalus microplus TaxID=6941 RepID=A0A9J6DME9_RHIMP|nr:hypothetical protein HPB51_014536 [Rhipicephalus microplus]